MSEQTAREFVRIEVLPAGEHSKFRGEGDTYRVLVGTMDALTTKCEKVARDCADAYRAQIASAVAAATQQLQAQLTAAEAQVRDLTARLLALRLMLEARSWGAALGAVTDRYPELANMVSEHDASATESAEAQVRELTEALTVIRKGLGDGRPYEGYFPMRKFLKDRGVYEANLQEDAVIVEVIDAALTRKQQRRKEGGKDAHDNHLPR